jgi:hypothetical protein
MFSSSAVEALVQNVFAVVGSPSSSAQDRISINMGGMILETKVCLEQSLKTVNSRQSLLLQGLLEGRFTHAVCFPRPWFAVTR